MLDELKKLQLNRMEMSFAEQWVSQWGYMIQCLKDTKEFSEKNLLIIIKYELDHKQRVGLLKRLTGRYHSLRRKREWTEVEAWLNGQGGMED